MLSSNVAKYIEACQDDPLVAKLANLTSATDLYQDEDGEVFLVLDTVKVSGMSGDARVVVYVALDGKWQLRVGSEKLFKLGERTRFVQVLPDYVRDDILTKPAKQIPNNVKVFDVIQRVLKNTRSKMNQKPDTQKNQLKSRH